jgi:hypothetical protein
MSEKRSRSGSFFVFSELHVANIPDREFLNLHSMSSIQSTEQLATALHLARKQPGLTQLALALVAGARSGHAIYR